MKPLLPRAPCSVDKPLRVGVLVSGSGSNLQALLDAAHQPGALFSIAVVISNVEGAFALERAGRANVPAIVCSHKGLTREAFEDRLLAELAAYDVEVVALAGFMRVLTAHFLQRYERRVVNVHPALLPSFPGMHGARQALQHGARITGCTVHLVDSGVDTGPILMQAAVPVLDDDDEAALQKRIQEQEHRLFAAMLQALARGDVVVDDAGRVRARGFPT